MVVRVEVNIIKAYSSKKVIDLYTNVLYFIGHLNLYICQYHKHIDISISAKHSLDAQFIINLRIHDLISNVHDTRKTLLVF